MPGTELEAGRAFVDLVPRLGAGAAAKMEAEVGGAFSGLTNKAQLAGKAIGIGLAGGAVAAAGGLFAIGASFDDAYDKIRVGTGLAGQDLEGLKDTFRAVVSDVPADFGEAADAISELTQKATEGADIEGLSKQLLELSRITESDLTTNIDGATEALNNWSVPIDQQTGKLDELFRVSQATGISFSDLASGLASGGSQFRQVGLDFEQSAALLGVLQKVGVDAGSVMGPLSKSIATAAKEGKNASDVLSETFDTIRKAPDDTSAAAAAIEVFGARAGPKFAGLIREGKLSYEDLAKTIAGGGDTILGAAADTQDASEKMKVAWNKVQVALEPVASGVFDLVGSLAEKLAPVIETVSEDLSAFFKTLTSGMTENDAATPIENFALLLRDTVLPIVQQIAGFIGDNLTPILVGLGVVVGGIAIGALVAGLVALVGALASPVVLIAALAAALVYAYTESETFRNIVDTVAAFLIETVVPAVVGFVSALSEQIANLAAWWSEHWAAIQEAVGHVVAVITTIVETFVAGIELVWDHFGDTITSVFVTAWDTIRATVQFAIDFIRGIIEFWIAIINGDFSGAWDAIVGIFSSAWDLIETVIGGALDTVKALFTDSLSAVTDSVSTAIETIVGFFVELPGRLASAAGDVFGFLWDSFRNVVNRVIEAWNNFGIPSFHVHVTMPSAIPNIDFDTPAIPFPDIPLLAAGGTALRAGLAIVGDDGPELLNMPRGATIAPLDATAALLEGLGAGGDTYIIQVPDGTKDPYAFGWNVKRGIEDAVRSA